MFAGDARISRAIASEFMKRKLRDNYRFEVWLKILKNTLDRIEFTIDLDDLPRSKSAAKSLKHTCDLLLKDLKREQLSRKVT
jgi:hypothetical protein